MQNELTDAQCDEFRRHNGDFNAMVRAIFKAGQAQSEAARVPEGFSLVVVKGLDNLLMALNDAERKDTEISELKAAAYELNSELSYFLRSIEDYETNPVPINRESGMVRMLTKTLELSIAAQAANRR